MKILIIADAMDNQHAGIHFYVKHMVEWLAKYDEENEYVIVRESPKPLAAEAEKSGRVIQHKLWNTRLPIGYASLRLFIMIPYLAMKYKVDAVLEPAHFGPFNLISSIRRITIIHDLTPIKFPELHRWHSQLLQKLFLKRILRKADWILTNSMHTMKDVCAFNPTLADKTTFIYPSIEEGITADFSTAEKEVCLQKFHVEKDSYILFIGTIEPRKNLLRLLQAFEQIKNDPAFAAYKLLIAGGIGWKSEDFLQAHKNSKHQSDVILGGYISQTEKLILLKHCLFFAYPSLYEGFGLPVLEAIAQGKACLISNNSSLPEVGGDCALYADPYRVEDLAEQMRSLLSQVDLRKKLEENTGQQRSKFSWLKFVQQWQLQISRLKN